MTLDKIARVKAALRGEQVDRIPASFSYHFPEEMCAGHAMAQAHLEYYRTADPDYLKAMNDNYYSAPNLELLSSPSDWAKLEEAPLSSQCFQDQLKGLREIVKAVGNEVPIVTTVFNPFQNGDGMSGWKATEHLKSDPEKVSQGLSTVTQSLERFVRACIEAGASGIFFAAHGGQRSRHSDEEFDQYIKPHDLSVLKAANDAGAWFNLLHVCGENVRFSAYTDYPAQAVNWAPQLGNPTLSEGRKLFKRTIVGGMEQDGALVSGSKEDIVSEVQRAVREMGSTGFMLGAGCALTKAVPAERLLWARQALHENQKVPQ
jgi:uroporphyrinogen decarboxylase